MNSSQLFEAIQYKLEKAEETLRTRVQSDAYAGILDSKKHGEAVLGLQKVEACKWVVARVQSLTQDVESASMSPRHVAAHLRQQLTELAAELKSTATREAVSSATPWGHSASTRQAAADAALEALLKEHAVRVAAAAVDEAEAEMLSGTFTRLS